MYISTQRYNTHKYREYTRFRLFLFPYLDYKGERCLTKHRTCSIRKWWRTRKSSKNKNCGIGYISIYDRESRAIICQLSNRECVEKCIYSCPCIRIANSLAALLTLYAAAILLFYSFLYTQQMLNLLNWLIFLYRFAEYQFSFNFFCAVVFFSLRCGGCCCCWLIRTRKMWFKLWYCL